MESILSSLNDKQLQAVTHVGSPLLILAGPGSGKTRVITSKIAWLIQNNEVQPQQILAMTFTNKAAREMVERVETLIGRQKVRPRVSTFHSFGAYLLRLFSTQVGINKDFQIYDADDQVSLLKQAYPKMDKQRLRAVMVGISRAKDAGLSYDAPKDVLETFLQEPKMYFEYEQLKKNTGNVDFGDLLLYPYFLLKRHPEIKQRVTNWWKWFLIDEYQDTNRVQFLLLQELCGHSPNVCVVGDDDQSIYGFRGAVVDNILTFKDKVKNTTVIKLEQNYRSTPQILHVANQVIDDNKARHGKKIFSTLEEGEKPHLILSQTDDEEIEYVTDIAKNKYYEKKGCAIFFRTNAQSRSYEMALQKARVPYVLVGAVGFFQRSEIKDVLALARLFRNQRDVISFLRIANKPARGIGAKSLETMTSYIKQGRSWKESFMLGASTLSAKARQGLESLQEVFDDVTLVDESDNDKKQMHSINSVCEKLIRKSGLLDLYRKQDKADGTERVSNVEELLSYAAEFSNDDEGWANFLERISLAEEKPDADKRHSAVDERIQLMTLHRSKGLEFDTVILCGVEENNIPMIRTLEDRSPTSEEIEEERRLFYVGITRAKQNLYLTCSRTRRRFGKIDFCMQSSFLDTLDEKSIVQKHIGNDENVYNQIDNYQRFYASTEKKKKRSFAESKALEDAREWNVGDKVYHEQYGGGFVQAVKKQGAHTVVHIEFDNENEGTFIPKFAAGLKKVTT